MLKIKDLQVKKSINGRGVFVTRDFLKKEIILEVMGPFVTCNVDEEMDEESRSNTFRFDDDFYISPKGTVANFVNHSCEPNTRVVKRNKKLFIESIITIKKGEEIFFDYSTIIASDDIWEMDCNCGSQKCRKVIGQFKFLPKNIKKFYISKNIVPSFILKI